MPSITGTVFISDADATPETDVIVRVYDIDLVNKQLLGEVMLQVPFRNTSQTFRIRYSSRQYQSAEGRGAADIQVEADTLDGLLAGETPIIFNAPDEVTDIRLELRPVENPPSEFERLEASLMPLMEDVLPADLTLEQIAFLSRDSQERRSRIIIWNEAAILTRDTGLPVEAGYGWFRQLRRPHTLAGLLEQSERLLRNTLIRTIRSNIISDITDQIDAILTQLNGLRTRVVFGSFTFDPPSRTEIESDVIMQAFDRDFRSEQLLGETRIAGPFGPPGSTQVGNYRIEYSEAQFQLNEARFADLIVRGRTEDDRYSVESDTHFNAGQETRIDLTLIASQTPEVATPDLSELEQLQADLEPIRENTPYADFTDEDIRFLVQELADNNAEQATLQQRLDFLRIAARHEQAVGILLAAFYGWLRQSLPTDLAALLDIPTIRLQTALEAAIREAIIPDISAQISEILDAIRSTRIEQGRLIRHRFVARLINAETSRPLGNILADVTDLDAEPDDQDNGLVDIDGQGILVLDFMLPADAPTDTSRRLQLILRDEERTLATIEINAVAGQDEVAEIQVNVEPTAEEQTPISDLASAPLSARLRDRGITTIEDLLSNPNPDEDENDELIRLRDRAKIAVLNPDLTEEQQTYLLTHSLASPQTIAHMSRAEFVSRYSEGLGGDAAAYTFYKANQDLAKVMHHQIAGDWLKIGTTPDDEDDEDPDIPTGVREIIEAQTNHCGCEDCTSAVSPAAYLAYLLDWMLTHIKFQDATVTFGDFVNEFHQPFGGLPTHCDAVTQEVRQVRLVVESLWRFIGRLDETDLQMPTPFRNDYRRLRNALYKAILTNLGVSFEQLRQATLSITEEGLTADQVAAQRTVVASILGVTETVVPELFFNVDHPTINPPEELLEETFGYENTRKQDRFAARVRPQLITWQREKLENQWQNQDWTSDDYSGANRQPYIDPTLINTTYLRTPLDANPAFTLLAQRQTLLDDHRQGMVESTSTDLAGLDALLQGELSQPIDQLQAWFDTLQAVGDERAVTEATESVTALHLTPAGFSHLMTTRSTLASGAALGDSEDEIAAVWNSVFDILSRAFRQQQFAAWVEQENDAEIVFGPKLFWPSVEPLALNPWLASKSEQTAWLAALGRRSQPPIIDPDQIPQTWVLTLRVVKDIQASEEEQNNTNGFAAGFNSWAIETPLDAFELWERRRAFVDARMLALDSINNNQANPLVAITNLLSASNTGLTSEVLLELKEMEAAGQDIKPHLDQLTLERSAYRLLAEVHTLAEAGTSIPVNIWEDAEAILVQVEKQREFAEWRNQEQETEITLHPNQFQISPPPNEVADPVRSEWLHDARVLNRWIATLEARQDQFETLETALANAVSAAEAQILTQLRDLLISDSAAPGDSIQEKAEWLDKRLLMDMSMGGCQMTTRVSQGIETLQRLVRGVYTQEHNGSLLEDFTLDAVEDYEAEWPVMGTYATWKAYMEAYLFPENLLHFSPTARQSHGLNKLFKALSSRINEQQACALATEYSSYFHDICNLEVQATCQLRSVYLRENNCDPVSNNQSTFTHVFARSTITGTVYWAYFKSFADTIDNISSWTPLGRLGKVNLILGTAPHKTQTGQELLLLFVGTDTNILMRKFDLNEGRWLGITKLDWPQGYESGISMGTVVQKQNNNYTSIFNFPTLVSATLKQGSTYICALNEIADAWENEGWMPLYGPEYFNEIDGIHSVAQLSHNRLLIFANIKRALHFRVEETTELDSYSYAWQKVSNEPFRGITTSVPPQMHGDSGFFCFYDKNQSTRYKTLILNERPNNPLDADTISFIDIADFNDNWLVPHLGVSLDDTSLYSFDDYSPEFFIPKVGISGENISPISTTDFDGNTIPTSEGAWSGHPHYSGSVLGLITRKLASFNFNPPSDAYFKQGNKKIFYLVQQKYFGIQEFLRFLSQIDSASYQDPKLGWWKYVNQRVTQATPDNLTFAEVLQALLINQLYSEADTIQVVPPRWHGTVLYFYASIEASLSEPSRFSLRETKIPQNSDLIPVGEGAEGFGSGGSGTQSAGTQRITYNEKILVIQKKRHDRYSVIVKKTINIPSEEEINISNDIILNPYGSGPFDLMPIKETKLLEGRRQEIKVMYRRLQEASIAVQSYLHEAYLHVPVALGYMLQKSGNYEQALIWYRQVYDYLQSTGKRKIYHYLKVEQQLPFDLEQADEYLNDSTNPHIIARTRKNTYTRHILLLIIRCLIDYADALFARDNVTDNARARELYTQALKFLDLKVLKPKKSACENILGELEVEIDGAGQLPLQQFQSVIAQIPNPDRLRTTVDNLRAIGWDTTGDVESRVDAMRAAIISGLSSVRSEAEELPPPKPLSTIVEQEKPQFYAALEAQYLSNSTPRSEFRKASQQRKQTQLAALAAITDTSQESIPWLRQARPVEKADDELNLAVLQPEVVSRLAVLDQIRQTAPLQSLVVQQFSSFAINTGISFSFCIPQNPVISALRRRAENNLTKLRTCRNIAGFLRQIDPYGAPITIGSGRVSADGRIFTGIVDAPPTPYRYATLVARAKELVNIAEQIESGYQSALEAAEREAFSVLQAEQNVELAGTRVVLQDLRINQANSQLGLANLQKGSAELREQTYAGWIAGGKNQHEEKMLKAYDDARAARAAANAAKGAAEAAGISSRIIGNTRFIVDAFKQGLIRKGLEKSALIVQQAETVAATVETGKAINAEALANRASFEASFERRNDEWQLQQGLAAQDILIGDQQIQLAHDGIAITQQERAIAELEQTHAANILQFLLSKTFTEEMYRWIASVLEDVYRYFLQEAASIARLAERQLAFERQQGALKLIQSDYWNMPLNGSSNNTDRLGITGSARLLKDIYQLDQYAFETRQRKQSVSVTLDLAELFPFEFQQFRETGILVFETPQSLIDQQFPGNYLCLIQQVTISAVALIPPTYGIRASLTSAGISQTVVGGDSFQTVTLRQLPERLALTRPTTSSGQILELQPDAQSLQFPFEGTGFATQWQLSMPKASNNFDYNSMATVLFTVDFTALHSFDYEQQIIEQLDRNVSANRAFRFRNEFADAWYDLNNPDQTEIPMVVRFETRRDDFPPNLNDLRIQHLILYFIRKDGETFEVPVRHLLFTEQEIIGEVGGSAQSIDGVISTRRGNGTSWLPMVGKQPFGVWELAFDETSVQGVEHPVRTLLDENLIEDILFVITYTGQRPKV